MYECFTILLLLLGAVTIVDEIFFSLYFSHLSFLGGIIFCFPFSILLVYKFNFSKHWQCIFCQNNRKELMEREKYLTFIQYCYAVLCYAVMRCEGVAEEKDGNKDKTTFQMGLMENLYTYTTYIVILNSSKSMMMRFIRVVILLMDFSFVGWCYCC